MLKDKNTTKNLLLLLTIIQKKFNQKKIFSQKSSAAVLIIPKIQKRIPTVIFKFKCKIFHLRNLGSKGFTHLCLCNVLYCVAFMCCIFNFAAKKPLYTMFSLNVPARYSNTVYNTIRPLYICSRLFGYSPFSATITKPSLNKIYLTRLDHFIFIIHVVAYASCAVFNFDLKFDLNISSSKLLIFGTRIQVMLGIVSSCFLLFVELVFRNYGWRIVESLNEFDIEVLQS